MAVGPQGIAVFVGTRKEEIWAVTDRDKNRVADRVKNSALSLAKSIPNGLCFSPDGFLYSVAQNRVVVYLAAGLFYESPDVVAAAVVPQGELIPEEEESLDHSARVCDIGPDGMLYIALGQPHNVPPADSGDLYNEQGIGGVIRLNQDGTGRDVFTRGIRNAMGMDFHLETGELWFTDNQVDGLGDDIPPGEINRRPASTSASPGMKGATSAPWSTWTASRPRTRSFAWLKRLPMRRIWGCISTRAICSSKSTRTLSSRRSTARGTGLNRSGPWFWSPPSMRKATRRASPLPKDG
jgi:hypothetical protein